MLRTVEVSLWFIIVLAVCAFASLASYEKGYNTGYSSRIDFEITECLLNNYCLRKVDPQHRGLIP